jgi:DNA-binding NarL/FixJ family response regulator
MMGRVGFIPKRMETATMVAVVEFILKGGTYLPPQALSTLLSGAARNAHASPIHSPSAVSSNDAH